MVLRTFVFLKFLFDLTFARENDWQQTMLWEDDPCEGIVLQNILTFFENFEKNTLFFSKPYFIKILLFFTLPCLSLQYSLSPFYHKNRRKF